MKQKWKILVVRFRRGQVLCFKTKRAELTSLEPSITGWFEHSEGSTTAYSTARLSSESRAVILTTIYDRRSCNDVRVPRNGPLKNCSAVPCGRRKPPSTVTHKA